MRDIGEVLTEFAAVVASEHTAEDLLGALSNFATELLPVHGVGVLLHEPEASGLVVGTANTELGKAVEVLESELGEGPCSDAVRRGEQVLAPDLEDFVEVYPRFAPRALEIGIRSVHALPMVARTDLLGALDVIGTEPKALDDHQLRTAQMLADVAVAYLINSRVLQQRTLLAQQLQHALDSRIVIEQAKGVLAERHGVGIDDAFALLRRHARNHGRKLRTVAEEVLRGEAEIRP